MRWVLEHRPATRIVVLDKLTYAGSVENLRDLPNAERFELIEGDIASTDDVAAAFAHARPTHVSTSRPNPTSIARSKAPRAF